MPVDKSDLIPATATCTTGGVTIGSTVGSNMRRYIYSIKTENEYTGPNTLTLTRDATNVDKIAHATQYEMWRDPEALHEDSLPIYIMEAGEDLTGTTDNGDCFVQILYVDGP